MKKLTYVVLILVICLGTFFYIKTDSTSNVSKKSNVDISVDSKFEKYEGGNTPVLDKYKILKKINNDIVGWISIPKTTIDYPIVRTTNNEYYLSHDILKHESSWGAVFMEYRDININTDKNIILYGHNMKDQSMFTQITKYKENEFFKNNRYIYFDTLNIEGKWEVFSAYVAEDSFNYIKTNFKTNEEYLKFLKAITDKSLFSAKVQLSAKDQILTLSTCSYEFKNARFVVHAKRVNK